MEEFVGQFVKDYLVHETESGLNEEESIVPVEEDHVEAVPYFVDEPSDFLTEETNEKRIFDMDVELKMAVQRELSQSGQILSMNSEVESNKIMIHDLKSSVVSLKVSTSRIERDVKQLGDNVGRFETEKKALDNSLIDLEFRFNELVTDQEADEKPGVAAGTPAILKSHSNNNNNNDNDDDADENNEQDFETLENKIKVVIDNLEVKVQKMDEKISTIDSQNMAVRSLSKEIEKHEQMVQNIRKMLAIQERELSNMTELKEFNSSNNDQDAIQQCQTPCLANGTALTLQKKLNEFIAKTEINEKSIETAWVGLVAALLLIPIAYFMGKFF